jgi:hypothetical protein
MKIIKLLLFTLLVNNFSKIENLKDIEKIDKKNWDALVTQNNLNKKEIIDLFLKTAPRDFIDNLSGQTMNLLDQTANFDLIFRKQNDLKDSINSIFENFPSLREEFSAKMQKAYWLGLLKAFSKNLAIVFTAYYSIQGLKYGLTQIVQPYFDRWGKHREFLAKLKPLKIKELRNPVVGYNLMRKHIDRVIAELKIQVTSGKKLDMDGLFLYGKPGNGKTTWVEFIAYETGLPLIVVNFNDLINSKSGTIEENLTLLFKELRKYSPCICFFDEIDLIIENKPEILAQLLQELDGLKSKQGIFMIAATNEKDVVRESLLRPGRFGVHFEVANPILSDIQLLVDLYLNKKGIDLDEELSYDAFVSSLQGLSCAGVRAYCNFLEKMCKENNTNVVTQSFIDEANFIYKR